MKEFADIHLHLLCNVDDGAKDPEEMEKMLELAYEDGTRVLCLTPHFMEYRFDEGEEKEYSDYKRHMGESFASLQAYAAVHTPDMKIYLGNEIMYHHDAVDNLLENRCNSMNDSRYVLVEFDTETDYHSIHAGISRLVSNGFRPILAHVERYDELVKDYRRVGELIESGALISANAYHLTGFVIFSKTCRFLRKLLEKRWIHVIASDAHNTDSRPPQLSACAAYLEKRYTEKYVRSLLYDNPMAVIRNQIIY